MPKPREITLGNRGQLHELWRRQHLVATRAQLRRRGMSDAAIDRALASERLHRVLRGVYAPVAPSLLPLEGPFAAAVLLGGDGARLCDATAGWWLRCVEHRPATIHVATHHTRRPVEGVTWHRLPHDAGAAFRHRRLLLTAPGRTALDFAVTATEAQLSHFLVELEFHFGIQGDALLAVLTQGHPGSAALRAALARHIPELAKSASHLERTFIRLLAKHGLKLPEIQHRLGLCTVDAFFHAERVVVELDGIQGHSGERRILRDHRRDLHRRRDGYQPLRYHYAQLLREEQLVIEDLLLAGIPRA